jgi:hypothetical protein
MQPPDLSRFNCNLILPSNLRLSYSMELGTQVSCIYSQKQQKSYPD